MTIRAAALVLLLALSACEGSDPQPLELVYGDTFYDGYSTIAGGGRSEFIVFGQSTYASQGVRVLRHRATAPDELEELGTVDLGWGSGNPSLFVSGDVAAVCPGATCWLVELAVAGLPSATVTLPVMPEALAIEGRWLVAGGGTALTLLDRQVGTSTTFTTAAPVTSVVASQGTFLAFTTGGYVHVTPDAAAPAFTETQHATLRNFRSAFPDGAEAVVAGPATSGRSRVLRLDLTSPAAPAIVHAAEIPAEFAAFAWDGGATSVVREASSWDYRFGGSDAQGYVLHEDAAGFTSAGIPLSSSSVAMHADRLFTLGWRGFGMYRINR